MAVELEISQAQDCGEEIREALIPALVVELEGDAASECSRVECLVRFPVIQPSNREG